MLEKLGIGEKPKVKKDLRSKKVIFVDDGLNPYRTMCFTIAAKLAKRRGAEVEITEPVTGEVPHAKVVDVVVQPKPKEAPAPDRHADDAARWKVCGNVEHSVRSVLLTRLWRIPATV